MAYCNITWTKQVESGNRAFKSLTSSGNQLSKYVVTWCGWIQWLISLNALHTFFLSWRSSDRNGSNFNMTPGLDGCVENPSPTPATCQVTTSTITAIWNSMANVVHIISYYQRPNSLETNIHVKNCNLQKHQTQGFQTCSTTQPTPAKGHLLGRQRSGRWVKPSRDCRSFTFSSDKSDWLMMLLGSLRP